MPGHSRSGPKRHAARSTGWSEAASPRRRQGAAVSPGRSRRPSRSSRPRNRDDRPIGSRTPRSSSSRSEGGGPLRGMMLHARRRRRTRWFFPVPVPVLLVAFAILQQLPPRRSPSGHSNSSSSRLSPSSSLSPREEEPNHPPPLWQVGYLCSTHRFVTGLPPMNFSSPLNLCVECTLTTLKGVSRASEKEEAPPKTMQGNGGTIRPI